MRFKDIVLLVGAVGGILVGLGKIFILAEAVKINGQKVEKLEPEVRSMSTRMAVADERWEQMDERWEQIQEQIKSINRKLDRNERDR